MKKLNLLSGTAFIGISLLLASCGGGTKIQEYLVTSGNENLPGLTKITDNAGQTVNSVSVSPNSPTLFIAVQSGSSCNIYKKDNPTSPAMSQITSGDVYCSRPSYNPATDRLAFRYQNRYNSNSWAKGDIFTLGMNNLNALSPVTQSATIEEYNPSFTPDGSVICYQSNSGSAGEMWLKNLKTNETTLIGSGMQPTISPDGKKIAFCRYKTNASDSPSSIWIMNIDGSNVTEVMSNPNQRMFAPTWSPDGTKIVFYAASKKGNSYHTSDIYVMNADGSGLTQLTTNDSNDYYPVWSTDGYIYFISDRGAKQGIDQVWRFKID